MSVSVLSHKSQESTGVPTAHNPRVYQSPAVEMVQFGVPVQRLEHGEILFRTGDPKTRLYRVESGSLCVYEPQSDGHRAVIEFAFAGDFLGLGYLENHACSAWAMVETRVTCFPLSEEVRLVEGSPRAREALQRAIDRELEFVRDSLVSSGDQNPIERVAAFLVTLSRSNKYEGRDPNTITDSVKCGFVASCLTLSVESLGRALVELEKRGLIESCPRLGLRLKDLDGLEELAGLSGDVLPPRNGPNSPIEQACEIGR